MALRALGQREPEADEWSVAERGANALSEAGEHNTGALKCIVKVRRGRAHQNRRRARVLSAGTAHLERLEAGPHGEAAEEEAEDLHQLTTVAEVAELPGR